MCRIVQHRGDKTDKKNKREGAMLRAHQGFGAKAMLHISVIHTVAQKKVHKKKVHKKKCSMKVFIPHKICVAITPAV